MSKVNVGAGVSLCPDLLRAMSIEEFLHCPEEAKIELFTHRLNYIAIGK